MIKSTSYVAAALLLSSAATFAQQKGEPMKGMDMPSMSAAASAPMATTHHATGVVKSVDSKAGLVTFAHGPVPDLNWPAMTMGFQVENKSLFDSLTVGKKVDFEFKQGKKGYLVTAVK